MIAKYPKYKDSGIEWIGEIPEHWEVKRMRYMASIEGGRDPKDVWDENGNYPIIGTGGVFGFANQYIYNKPSILLGRKGTIDNPQFVTSPFWAVDTTYYTKIFPNLFINFFYYLCKTIRFDQFVYGSAIPSMTRETLENIYFAFPCFSEQTTIADFLDRKTTAIDQLIANKERLIILYEEEKTALINHAVTKGLDPHALMKDSGIEWIGEIPEHWEVKKVKHCLKSSKGAIKTGPFGSQLKSSDFTESGEYRVINQRNVLDNDFSKNGERIDSEKFNELKEFEIFANDILVTSRGSIGKCSVFPETDERCVLHPCLIRLQISEKVILIPWMTIYFNSSSFFRENAKLESNSTVIDVIYGHTLKEIVIPTPSVLEQTKIIEFIEQEIERIEDKIEKTQKLIDLLQEYKTALISEAVTGKIRVIPENAHE